jgi:hypothetical protein
MTLQVSATDYSKVGVRVGDMADYSRSDPFANFTIHLQILKIIGTSITANFHEVYPDGTLVQWDKTLTGNITGSFNALYPFLIPANLNQGDIIPNQPRINETTTMNVIGLNRTVDHLHTYEAPRPFEDYSYYYDAYWDKATGLLVRLNSTIVSTFAGTPTLTYIFILTSTTAFTTTSPAEAILVLTAGITITAAIIIILAITQKRNLNRH